MVRLLSKLAFVSMFCLLQIEPGIAAGKKTMWISGRVLTVKGDPIEQATVRVEVERDIKGKRNLETNLQGEFESELRIDSAAFTRLRGTVFVNKKGFKQGLALFDFGLDEENAGVDVVLQDLTQDPDQLSMSSLIHVLGQQLKKQLPQSQEDFVRGCEELMDRNNSAAAVALLMKSVDRAPNCLECRAMLSLALLDTGGWGAVNEQISRMTELNEARTKRRPEPDLILGVVKGWQGHLGEAAGLYLKALEADPKNGFALRELGRTLVAQKNWEAADQYLEKAIQAGANEETRLLRVRTLLELGEVAAAAFEMDRLVAGREIKSLAQPERNLYHEVKNRSSLVERQQVKSVIAQPAEEIMRTVPELAGLQIAADQALLEEILDKAGESVDAFFKTLPNTASTEIVRQEQLGKDGKIKDSADREFNYFMVADAAKPGFGIKEYRTTADGQDSLAGSSKKGLMISSGFASVSSILHPANRKGAEFRYLGRQTLNGYETHVIAFAQKPETAKMTTSFVTEDRSAIILVHGLAWIDAEKFHLIRLHTFLLNPLPEVRLQKQTTEIEYGPVEFNGGATLWLPSEVRIAVNWRGRVMQNRHRYSDFKLFSVESREEREKPSAPAPVAEP